MVYKHLLLLHHLQTNSSARKEPREERAKSTGDCQRTIPRPLERVRTRIQCGRRGGPRSTIAQLQTLSRLRRYRVGNCTFVTFKGQGNQHESPAELKPWS